MRSRFVCFSEHFATHNYVCVSDGMASLNDSLCSFEENCVCTSLSSGGIRQVTSVSIDRHLVDAQKWECYSSACHACQLLHWMFISTKWWMCTIENACCHGAPTIIWYTHKIIVWCCLLEYNLSGRRLYCVREPVRYSLSCTYTHTPI